MNTEKWMHQLENPQPLPPDYESVDEAVPKTPPRRISNRSKGISILVGLIIGCAAAMKPDTIPGWDYCVLCAKFILGIGLVVSVALYGLSLIVNSED